MCSSSIHAVCGKFATFAPANCTGQSPIAESKSACASPPLSNLSTCSRKAASAETDDRRLMLNTVEAAFFATTRVFLALLVLLFFVVMVVMLALPLTKLYRDQGKQTVAGIGTYS